MLRVARPDQSFWRADNCHQTRKANRSNLSRRNKIDACKIWFCTKTDRHLRRLGIVFGKIGLGGSRLKVLLDTHIWLWYAQGEERLPKNIRKIIQNHDNLLFISTISIWEAYLLDKKGRIQLPNDADRWISESLIDMAVNQLPVTHEVLRRAQRLFDLHSDPADLFIVGTAMMEGLTLLSCDEKFLVFDKLKLVQG